MEKNKQAVASPDVRADFEKLAAQRSMNLDRAPGTNDYASTYTASVWTGYQAGRAAQGQAEPVVTPDMVAAYLAANTAYWLDVDKLPSGPTKKWRQGTPSDATAVSLRAALAAAPQPNGPAGEGQA